MDDCDNHEERSDKGGQDGCQFIGVIGTRLRLRQGGYSIGFCVDDDCVLVDGGCVLIRSFGRKFPKFQVLRHRRSKGVTSRRGQKFIQCDCV